MNINFSMGRKSKIILHIVVGTTIVVCIGGMQYSAKKTLREHGNCIGRKYYSSGTFIVGKTMPRGEYIAVADSNVAPKILGSKVPDEQNNNGFINISNPYSNNKYAFQSTARLTLKRGEKVIIEGCKVYPFYSEKELEQKY